MAMSNGESMIERSVRRLAEWSGRLKRSGLRRWRLLGLLSAMVVVVALPYLIVRASTADVRDAEAWVTHSAEVTSLVYRIAFEVRDSEAAIYRLLDGEDSANLRQRASLAAADTPALVLRLHAMTADNPAQQAAVGALDRRVNGRLALIRQALLRYEEGDRAGALAALRDADVLYRLTDQIGTILGNEGKLLSERRAASAQRAFRSNVILGVTCVAQLLLLAIIVLVSEWQIGRRIEAEAAENRAVQRALMILEAVREPIALLDDELRILLANAAFRELYGLPEGVRPTLMEAGDGAWADNGLQQRLRDVLLRDRELWDYELTQRTMDGMERRVVINARRLEQEGDTAPVLLLTASDVTARALVEQQVKELNRQLNGKIEQISDANRELEAFSYSVSHDLRAPLRHVAGFITKLERHLGDGVDATAQHYLNVVRDAARRMAELIDELLVFSRLGRGAMRLQTVDMQTLVDEARALAESEAGERRIVWKIAPLPVVVGDANMLRTVWQNLLGNAVKYTGQREVAHIEVNVQRDEEGGCTFSVSDDGVGFDMAYADKLFGVFQRLHKPTEFPGNGIGLANVRRIIVRHGGRVWAHAEPGKGATFYFYLPPADRIGEEHSPAVAARGST